MWPLKKSTKRYAAEDADITLQLKGKIGQMVEQREVSTVLNAIEHPLVIVLADMEREGVNIDETFLRDYSAVLEKEMIEVRENVFSLAGMNFNLNSPKQLSDVLYNHLHLPFEGKKTSTGQLSTNEDALNLYPDIIRL